MFRHCRKNAAKAEANPAGDRQGPVEQANQPEQRKRHRRQPWRGHGRKRRDSAASRRDGLVSSKVHGKVSLHKIRHRVTIN